MRGALQGLAAWGKPSPKMYCRSSWTGVGGGGGGGRRVDGAPGAAVPAPGLDAGADGAGDDGDDDVAVGLAGGGECGDVAVVGEGEREGAPGCAVVGAGGLVDLGLGGVVDDERPQCGAGLGEGY